MSSVGKCLRLMQYFFTKTPVYKINRVLTNLSNNRSTVTIFHRHCCLFDSAPTRMATAPGQERLTDHSTPGRGDSQTTSNPEAKSAGTDGPSPPQPTDTTESTAISQSTESTAISQSTESTAISQSTESTAILVSQSTEPENLSKRALKRLKKQAEKKDCKKKKKRKEEINSEDIINETSYYYENGLRKVYPYYYTFSTYVKGRWLNRPLLEVFCQEFKHFADSEFENKIRDGSVSVNGLKVGVDYKLKSNDLLSNVSHRHEVAVTAEPIQILHEDSEMLVINKPSSLPCHPCGSFRHNSAIFILQRDHGYTNLKFVHRLDRLTSGVLLLAKTREKAVTITHQVATRQVLKEYICKVVGEFPDGVIECKQPLNVLSFKLGVQKVCPNGKESWTTFERVSSAGGHSIVRCRPHTGRTHQIRVHLQYLGFPIVNDPLYNSEVWGPNKGKGGDFGMTEAELIHLILKEHDKSKFVYGLSDDQADVDANNLSAASPAELTPTDIPGNLSNPIPECIKHPSVCGEDGFGIRNDSSKEFTQETLSKLQTVEVPVSSENSAQQLNLQEGPVFEPSKLIFDPCCLDCKRKFKDPRPEELVMFLHALKYKGPDWEFTAPWPAWASEDS